MVFGFGFPHLLLLRFVYVFRLRARLRALLFAIFTVKHMRVESPGSLNPWVAAGGGEVIRIKVETLPVVSALPQCTAPLTLARRNARSD